MWVRRQVQKVDVSAVSASIHSRLYFIFGAGDTGRAAWHAVKVHNVCRPMSAGEDSCERIGSIMKSAWDPRADPDPHTLLDKVLLRNAGVQCAGGAYDERLCRSVAEAMVNLGRDPFASSVRHKSAPTVLKKLLTAQTARRLTAGRGDVDAQGSRTQSSDDDAQGSHTQSDEDISASIVMPSHYGLRSRGEFKSWRSERIQESRAGMRMSSSMASTLREHAQGSRTQGVQPLPIDPVRANAQGDSLRAWLQSDDGKKWVAERRAHLLVDEPRGLAA